MFTKAEKQEIDWAAQIETLRRTVEEGRGLSVIGAEDFVIGDLETGGTLQVFGRVKGDIRGHTVVVEPGSQVEGNITAQRSLICGQVTGQICATEVGIEGTAVVVGSIIHHHLAIEPGALLEGRRPWRPRPDFD